jgi:HK97 family phage prohead protease
MKMSDRVRLPDEVRARLGERGLASLTTRFLGDTVEQRAWSRAELRSSEAAGGGLQLLGYASSYEKGYPIFGGPERGGFNETMADGAFARTIKNNDDVRLLVNHEGIALARTKSGTMTLESDKIGPLVVADLDGASPIVAGLRSAMERGDMDQMSVAFEVVRQEWNGDFSERRILEVKLFDVSVVTYPANDQTLALVSVGADLAEVEPRHTSGRSVRMAAADWRR